MSLYIRKSVSNMHSRNHHNGKPCNGEGCHSPTVPTIAIDDNEHRKRDCEVFMVPPTLKGLFSVESKVVIYIVKDEKEGRLNDRLGLSSREAWAKLDDGSEWEVRNGSL